MYLIISLWLSLLFLPCFTSLWVVSSSLQRPKLQLGITSFSFTLKLIVNLHSQCLLDVSTCLYSSFWLLVQGHTCYYFLPQLLQWSSSWFPPIIFHTDLNAQLIASHPPPSPSIVLCGPQCEDVIPQDQCWYFGPCSLWNLLQRRDCFLLIFILSKI